MIENKTPSPSSPIAEVTPAYVRELATAADADERSVWKVLAGGRVRGRVGKRIARVLAERRDAQVRAGAHAA